MTSVHYENRAKPVADIEGRSKSIALSQPGVVHNNDQKYRKVGTSNPSCYDQ